MAVIIPGVGDGSSAIAVGEGKNTVGNATVGQKTWVRHGVAKLLDKQSFICAVGSAFAVWATVGRGVLLGTLVGGGWVALGYGV